MPHMLHKLHKGPHLYGPGGVGWVQLDIAPFVPGYQAVVQSLELPGFVERNVTYESHRFWIHWLASNNPRHTDPLRNVLIVVNHGGGWEVWRGDYMLSRALYRFDSDPHGLFLLCWYLIDTTATAEEVGFDKGSDHYRKAFVEGRLKKRALPKRNAVKVWIEPPPAAAPRPEVTMAAE